MESTLTKKKKRKIVRRLFQLKKATTGAQSTSSSTNTDSSINYGYQKQKLQKLRKKRSKQLCQSSKDSNFDHIVFKKGASIVYCDINRNSYWTALNEGSSYQTNYVPLKSQPEFQIKCQFRFALQPPSYDDNNQRVSTGEIDRNTITKNVPLDNQRYRPSDIFDNTPRSRKPVIDCCIWEECQTTNLNRLRRPTGNPLKNRIDELEIIYNSLHLDEDDQLLDRADEIETNLQENRRKQYENQNGHGHLKREKNEFESEADAIKDDMFNRDLTYKNQTLKIQEHQPPFGIPLRPIQFSTSTDYLNAPPPSSYRKTSFNKEPDLIKDDLAYRMLRKEQNEVKKIEVNLDYEYKKLCNRLLKCLTDITDLIVVNNRNEKLLHSPLNLDTNNNEHKQSAPNDINNNNVITTDTKP